MEIAQTSLTMSVDDFSQKSTDYKISILASNDLEVMRLNEQFRGFRTATNILSWPEHAYSRIKPGGQPELIVESQAYFRRQDFLGNLAISFDRCSSEAEEANITFEDHITHLLIHGCLHLFGFDHEDELDAKRMEDTEIRLLSRLGITSPYKFNIQ